MHWYQKKLLIKAFKALSLLDFYFGLKRKSSKQKNIWRPCHVSFPYIYPQKMSENQRFSDVFRGYINGTLAWDGLTEQQFSIISRALAQLLVHKRPHMVVSMHHLHLVHLAHPCQMYLVEILLIHPCIPLAQCMEIR